MARCIRQLVIISVLVAALASCRGNDGGGSLSRGDLYPNGTETFGSVVEGGECFYVLRNIKAGGSYTLRTQIAPGSTVRLDVYTSEAEYKNGQLPFPVETPVYPLPPNDIIHEVVFTPLTSGDYVVVLSGTAGTDGFGTLYFYDLRLMTSAADYLKTLTTSTPSSFTSSTLIGPGSLHVYSGASITPGTYSISLFSMFTTSLTTTLSYPQMFVYGDNSLTIKSLLHSVTSTTSEFIVSRFTTTLETSPTGTVYSTTSTTEPSSSSIISNVTFTSNGPYILLRGAAQVNYTLTVGP